MDYFWPVRKHLSFQKQSYEKDLYSENNKTIGCGYLSLIIDLQVTHLLVARMYLHSNRINHIQNQFNFLSVTYTN